MKASLRSTRRLRKEWSVQVPERDRLARQTLGELEADGGNAVAYRNIGAKPITNSAIARRKLCDLSPISQFIFSEPKGRSGIFAAIVVEPGTDYCISTFDRNTSAEIVSGDSI